MGVLDWNYGMEDTIRASSLLLSPASQIRPFSILKHKKSETERTYSEAYEVRS